MDDLKYSRWRFHLVFATLAAALLALTGRVAHLQLARGGQLIELARRQQRRKVLLPARPGNIFR